MRKGRDILSEYGNDSGAGNKPRATGRAGAVTMATKRDVMNYSPPQGPTNIGDPQGPGLHGYNCGNRNTPTGCDGAAGKPGLGGTNKGIANKFGGSRG